MATNRKYILVLSGGGARGAFQAGALKYIKEHGWYHGEEHILGKDIHFDYIAGISAGSLNAVMMAMDQCPELLNLWEKEIADHPEKIWTSEFIDNNLKPKKGILKKVLPSFNFWRGLGLIFSKKKKERLVQEVINNILSIEAFASNDPLAEQLKVADLNKIKDTLLRVGFVSLNTGKYHSTKHTEFGDNNMFRKAILASCAMPVVWKPIKDIRLNNGIMAKNLVDGGIRNSSPLGDVFGDISKNWDANTEYYMVIINNHGKGMKEKNYKQPNFLEVAYRSLVEITLNEIFLNDISEFKRINKMVVDIEKAKSNELLSPDFELMNTTSGLPYRKFKYQIIEPTKDIGAVLDFSKNQIDLRIHHGFEMARNIFGSERQITDRTATEIELEGSAVSSGTRNGQILMEEPNIIEEYWKV